MAMHDFVSDVLTGVERLNAIIEGGGGIVFFGGAGVSTESGIPDFRSAKGLYSGTRGGIPPEKILSHSYFMGETEKFFDFYRKNNLFLEAEPNAAHLKLAELERAGRLSAVITQNIDGLHQKAGSKTVVELHGSVYRNNCMDCGKPHDVWHVAQSHGVPRCMCGGVVKPGVVLYEEGLDNDVMELAIQYMRGADILIVGGTSLVVYPAAGLVKYYKGGKLIIINMSETDSDRNAVLRIRCGIGEVMNGIV
jgi:NAD-dependent deacetylase